jgi:hypothetical protein
MMIAFMWVVIGDLVSIHMELIFGTKNINWHHPFAKTQKSDSKTFKVKTDKKSHHDGGPAVAILNEQQQNGFFESWMKQLYFVEPDMALHLPCPGMRMRGPPSLT